MFRNYFDPDQSEYRIITGSISIMLLIFILDIFVPPKIVLGLLYTLPLVVAMRSRNTTMLLYVTAAVSFLGIIGIFISPASGEMLSILINISLAIGVIWLVTLLGLRLQRNLEEKESALFEIKRLTGLLPICTLCNKVREDAGYWEQIESYIHKKSEVEFSHGICPECEAKLYPEIEHKV